MKMSRLMVGFLMLPVGCASLGGGEGDKADLSMTQKSRVEYTPIAAEAYVGMANYPFGSATHQVEFINCKMPASKATIIVVHSDRAGFDVSKFCDGWIAQSFLSQGFDVIAVNRPGYGNSKGSPDFSGAQSIAAMENGVKAALKVGKNPQPSGIFGFSTGVTAAAFLSKKIPDLKFLILGSGVYDYEATLAETKDSYLKKDLTKIKDSGGNKAIEDRSIAYDVGGLPKTIFVYHGKQNTAVSPEQAKAFSDSLESNEYQVTFQVLEGVSQDIPWMHHRQILEVIAKSLL
jgi:pimeloyl-ACP methyl ester carboxylesterase